MIRPDSLRNEVRDGQTAGFTLAVRHANYRGCYLSLHNGYYIEVDGVEYPPPRRPSRSTTNRRAPSTRSAPRSTNTGTTTTRRSSTSPRPADSPRPAHRALPAVRPRRLRLPAHRRGVGEQPAHARLRRRVGQDPDIVTYTLDLTEEEDAR
ncbi:DUF6379 domain-containing protein [Streptomyces sp. M19]